MNFDLFDRYSLSLYILLSTVCSHSLIVDACTQGCGTGGNSLLADCVFVMCAFMDKLFAEHYSLLVFAANRNTRERQKPFYLRGNGFICASQCIPITIGVKERMEAEPLQTISKHGYVISDNHRYRGEERKREVKWDINRLLEWKRSLPITHFP